MFSNYIQSFLRVCEYIHHVSVGIENKNKIKRICRNAAKYVMSSHVHERDEVIVTKTCHSTYSLIDIGRIICVLREASDEEAGAKKS